LSSIFSVFVSVLAPASVVVDSPRSVVEIGDLGCSAAASVDWASSWTFFLASSSSSRFFSSSSFIFLSFLFLHLHPASPPQASGFPTKQHKMQNEEGQVVDLYFPRKCSATNRLITAKDHASVQINVGKVNAEGKLTGELETFALCGYIRAMGEADAAFNRLTREAGLTKRV